MHNLFRRCQLRKRFTGAAFVLITGMALVTKDARADNYQRLSAVDCTFGDETNYLFDGPVTSSRFYARNLESNSREFFCAIPMESSLDSGKIKAITAYVYLGHNGTDAVQSPVEDIMIRPCAMLGGTSGECAGATYSKTPIGYKTINVSLSGGIPNVFTTRSGFTAYIRVYLPGVGASYPSRIHGFLVSYDP